MNLIHEDTCCLQTLEFHVKNTLWLLISTATVKVMLSPTHQHPSLSSIHCQGRSAGQKPGATDVEGDPLVPSRVGWSWLGRRLDDDFVEIAKKFAVVDFGSVASEHDLSLEKELGILQAHSGYSKVQMYVVKCIISI